MAMDKAVNDSCPCASACSVLGKELKIPERYLPNPVPNREPDPTGLQNMPIIVTYY